MLILLSAYSQCNIFYFKKALRLNLDELKEKLLKIYYIFINDPENQTCIAVIAVSTLAQSRISYNNIS